jgi:hypothetical protein
MIAKITHSYLPQDAFPYEFFSPRVQPKPLSVEFLMLTDVAPRLWTVAHLAYHR